MFQAGEHKESSDYIHKICPDYISESLRDKAIKFLDVLEFCIHAPNKPQIAPGANGQIAFNWSFGQSFFLIVDLFDDGNIDIYGKFKSLSPGKQFPRHNLSKVERLEETLYFKQVLKNPSLLESVVKPVFLFNEYKCKKILEDKVLSEISEKIENRDFDFKECKTLLWRAAQDFSGGQDPYIQGLLIKALYKIGFVDEVPYKMLNFFEIPSQIEAAEKVSASLKSMVEYDISREDKEDAENHFYYEIYGVPLIPMIEKILIENKNENVKRGCVRTLGTIGSLHSLRIQSLLNVVVSEKSSRVRYGALSAIAKIGTPYKDDAGIIALQFMDNCKMVRQDASRTLRFLGSTVDFVLTALLEASISDSSQSVRESARKTLEILRRQKDAEQKNEQCQAEVT